MSATRAMGNKLATRLRDLFATLRRQASVPNTAPPTAAANSRPPERLLAQPPVIEPESASAPGPVPDKPTAGRGQQIVLFEPPDPRPGERAAFLQDFVARFREAMRRSGVIARDPLYPVFTMLGEMLVHFSHLQVDQAETSRQVTSQFVAEMAREGARVREVVSKETGAVAEVLVRASERIEALIGEARTERVRLARDLESELKTTLRGYALARTSRERLITTGGLLVMALAIGAGGVWYGKSSERELMQLSIRAFKQPILAAAMRDGSQTAGMWLGIMNWNHLGQVPKTCTPQPFGSGTRNTCTMTFWSEPPPVEPPPG